MQLVHEQLRRRGPARINKAVVDQFERLQVRTDSQVIQVFRRNLIRMQVVHNSWYDAPVGFLSFRVGLKLYLQRVEWNYEHTLMTRMLEHNAEHQKRTLNRSLQCMILWGAGLTLLSWIRACSL